MYSERVAGAWALEMWHLWLRKGFYFIPLLSLSTETEKRGATGLTSETGSFWGQRTYFWALWLSGVPLEWGEGCENWEQSEAMWKGLQRAGQTFMMCVQPLREWETVWGLLFLRLLLFKHFLTQVVWEYMVVIKKIKLCLLSVCLFLNSLATWLRLTLSLSPLFSVCLYCIDPRVISSCCYMWFGSGVSVSCVQRTCFPL